MKELFFNALFKFLAKFWFTPKNTRHALLRKLLNLKSHYISEFSFQVATVESQVIQSLELLKQSEKNKSQFDHLSKWKINKFLTLPSSTLVTATFKGEVIAVAGLLIDNPLGLPCEVSSQVSHLREKGHRVGEVLGLTVLKNPFVSTDTLALALNYYLVQFAKTHLKVDYLVAPIPRGLEDFYQGVLCYTKYSDEEGKEVYADDNTLLNTHILNVHSFALENLSPEQKANFAHVVQRFDFPKSEFFVGSYSAQSTQIVQKLYLDKSPLFENLTINDRLTLQKIYTQKSFRNLIPMQAGPMSSRRSHVRYPSACPAVIHDGQENLQALATDVSFKGLSLITQSPLIKKYKMAQSIKLTIQIAENRLVTLEGEVIWKSSSKSAVGICLNKALPTEWMQFIDYLDSKFTETEYKKVG